MIHIHNEFLKKILKRKFEFFEIFIMDDESQE